MPLAARASEGPDGALVESSQVGLITHKDCERAMAEALGIPEHRSGHFWGMRGSNRLEDCTILLVVGTPALRPEHVARLARAYYHADPQVIDETSERSEDGTWRYLDQRLQRVAEALVRAELTQCAHRNRPLRHDGHIVVTLCASEILDLPVTTEITSLPQLTAEGVPLALARREAEATRLRLAAEDLEARSEVVSVRALAKHAHISINTACTWHRTRQAGANEPEPVLSTLPYSCYSIADNTATFPTAEPTEPSITAGAAASSGHPLPDDTIGLTPVLLEPTPPVLALTPTGVCPAASHQLLWYWTADAWHCPLCGTACAPAPAAHIQYPGGKPL